MKIKLLAIAILLGLWSCGDQASSETTQDTQQEQVTQQIEEIQEQETAEKIVVATYESAASYAARTDYGFSVGEEFILIEGNTFEEEPIIELPDNMLESDEELEGPPGANPELVGKSFNLYYNSDGIVYKIELVEE